MPRTASRLPRSYFTPYCCSRILNPKILILDWYKNGKFKISSAKNPYTAISSAISTHSRPTAQRFQTECTYLFRKGPRLKVISSLRLREFYIDRSLLVLISWPCRLMRLDLWDPRWNSNLEHGFHDLALLLFQRKRKWIPGIAGFVILMWRMDENHPNPTNTWGTKFGFLSIFVSSCWMKHFDT